MYRVHVHTFLINRCSLGLDPDAGQTRQFLISGDREKINSIPLNHLFSAWREPANSTWYLVNMYTALLNR